MKLRLNNHTLPGSHIRRRTLNSFLLFWLIMLLLFLPYFALFQVFHQIQYPDISPFVYDIKKYIKFFGLFAIIPCLYFYFIQKLKNNKLAAFVFAAGFNFFHFFSCISLILYYNYFLELPNPLLLFSRFFEIYQIRSQIFFQLMNPFLYSLLILGLLNIFFAILWIKEEQKTGLDNKSLKLRYNTTISLLIIYFCFLILQFLRMGNPLYALNYGLAHTARAYGPVITYVAMFVDYLGNKFKAQIHVPYPGKISRVEYQVPEKMSSVANVIIIQVESLDKSLLGAKLGDKEITPFLNTWKQKVHFFDNFFAQHSGGGSSDAELAALLGLHPLPTKSGFRTFNPERNFSLIDSLKAADFTTQVFHANNPSAFARGVAYKKLGIDKLCSELDYTGEARGFFSKDQAFLEQTLAKIKKLQTPFFAYLITVQSHGPFRNYSPQTKAEFSPEINNFPRLKQDYFAVMHEVDAALGWFIQAFSRLEISKKTVVILYADHLSNCLDKNMGYENIPLFISMPGVKSKVFSTIGSLIDIAPTIHHLLAIKEQEPWLGSSLYVKNPVKKTTVLHDAQLVQFAKDKLLFKMSPDIEKYINYSRFKLTQK